MFCTRIDKPWINDKESGYLWSYYSADTKHWSQILKQHFSYSSAFVFESGITTCFWILNSMLFWDIPQTLWIYCGHLCSWIYIAFLFEYFLSLIFKARVTHFHLSRLEYFETLIWRSGLHNVNILASIQSSNDAYFHLIVISSAGGIQQTMPRVFFCMGNSMGVCVFSHLDKMNNLFWTGG